MTTETTLTPAQTELRAELIRRFDDTTQSERFTQGERYDSTDVNLVNRQLVRNLGAVLTTLPPGKLPCPYHLHHAQTEMFVVLRGHGTLRVAGVELPIAEGDTITIPPGPNYPHHIINTSDAPLTYLSISTRETPELCEYPDSGKFLASAGPTTRFINRKDANLDYWHGE